MTFLPFYCLTGSFGALALVSQVILLRQFLAVFRGNEMMIGLVLGGWLAGIFLGAQAAGLLHPERRNLRLWLWVWPVAWVLSVITTLVLACYLPVWIGLEPGAIPGFESSVKWPVLLTAPSSFFAGALFVLAGAFLDVAKAETVQDRRGIGPTVFWIESAGACLGLSAFTFLFAGRIGPMQIILLFSGLVVLCQFAMLPSMTSTRLIGSAIIVAAAVLIHFTGLGDRIDQSLAMTRFNLAHPRARLLENRDTPYQHLVLAEQDGKYAWFGNNALAGTWPNPYDFQRNTLFFLTEASRPQRILVAGLGPGAYLHEILQQDVRHVVYAALDPAEIPMLRGHLDETAKKDLSDPRLVIVQDDLTRYLGRRDSGPFDLILINAPAPESAFINRFYTLEFFRLVRERLSDRGVLITAIDGSDRYWRRDMLSYGHSLFQTLKIVFPDVLITPGDTHFFIAGVRTGLVTADPQKLAERYRTLGFDSPFMAPRSMLAFFPPSDVAYVEKKLEEAQSRARHINTDSAPLSYLLHLVWWEKMVKNPRLQKILSGAMNAGGWWIWVSAALILPMILAAVFPNRSFAASWTIFHSGGTAMALQIILLYFFQNRYGTMYQQLGLFSGLFMGGLAIGGIMGRILVRFAKSSVRLLPSLEILLAMTAGLAATTVWGRTEDMSMYLMAAAGLIGGIEFALLYRLALPAEDPAGVTQTMSRLAAAGHAGAFLGAVATGLVLAPVAGLGLTAAMLAGFKVLNGIALLRASWSA